MSPLLQRHLTTASCSEDTISEEPTLIAVMRQASSLLGPCSGQGICNSTTQKCVCNPGWNGLSDWVDSEGIDCQINEATIIVFWVLTLAVYVSTMIWGIPKVVSTHARLAQVKKQRIQKSFSVAREMRANGTLMCCAIHIGVTTPAAIVLGILEITTDERIGLDWLPTIVFLIWRTAFYGCATVFQPYILSTIVGRVGRDARNAVKRFEWGNNVLTAYTWIIGFIVLGGILAPTEIGQIGTFMAYSFLVAVAQTGYFLQAKFTRDNIAAILDKSFASMKNEQILQVKEKLVRSQSTVMKQTLILAPINLLYGCIPFLWNKFPYFLPFSVLLPGLLFVNVLRTVASDTRKPGDTSHQSENSSHDLHNNSHRNMKPPSRSGTGLSLDPNLIAITDVHMLKSVQSIEEEDTKEAVTVVNLETVTEHAEPPPPHEQIVHQTMISPARIFSKLSNSFSTTPKSGSPKPSPKDTPTDAQRTRENSGGSNVGKVRDESMEGSSPTKARLVGSGVPPRAPDASTARNATSREAASHESSPAAASAAAAVSPTKAGHRRSKEGSGSSRVGLE